MRSLISALTLVSLLAAADTPQARSIKPLPAQRLEAISHRDRFEEGEKVAIIASVGNYTESDGLTPLRFTMADAVELSRELKRHGYTVIQLLNNEATADAIRRTIEQTGRNLEKNATLLFFFSGHGYQINGANHLATFGTTADTLGSRGLSVDELQRAMAATGAQRRVLLLDACRNNAGKSAGSARTFSTFQNAEGLSVLFSTRPGGVSYENPNLQHGVFTHYLLKGLRGEAAPTDGLITFNDLASFVTKGVYDYSTESNDGIQKPFSLIDGSGDFLLASAGKISSAEASKVQSVPLPTNSGYILRQLGGDGSGTYLLDLDQDRVRIYTMPSMTPFAELANPKDVPGGYKVFTGTAGENTRVDAAVLFANNRPISITGRVGRPRPQGFTGASNFVPLPGDPASDTRQTIEKGSKMACAAGQTLRVWLKGAGVAADRACDTATKMPTQHMTTFRDQYDWKSFNLTLSRDK